MLCLLLLLLSCSLCGAVSDRKVLVLVDNLSMAETHSLFLSKLGLLGFHTEIKAADDPSLRLKLYGEYLYQHIVMFAPTAEELGGDLTVASIVEFIDDGGNMILAAGTQTSDLVREIASEVGVEIDEEGTTVIDHLNFDAKDEGQHSLIVADPANLIKSERIVGIKSSSPFLYQGLGMATDAANPLVLNILTGASTSYSHNPVEPIKDYPHAVGKNTVLIAGLQARNNARVLVAGSVEFFSDKFFTSLIEKPGNSAEGIVAAGNARLSVALVSWCFHQTGVIRIDTVSHRLVGGDADPTFYTVREQCEFSLQVSEFVYGAWVPFAADDVQMEFVRIDPFVRQRMADKGDGLFVAAFKIPDVYGVFKFTVDYARLGLTRISSSTQVSVHPLRHNQYERFIYSAYPYYASAFSMMGGVIVFALVFLHYKEETKSKSE